MCDETDAFRNFYKQGQRSTWIPNNIQDKDALAPFPEYSYLIDGGEERSVKYSDLRASDHYGISAYVEWCWFRKSDVPSTLSPSVRRHHTRGVYKAIQYERWGCDTPEHQNRMCKTSKQNSWRDLLYLRPLFWTLRHGNRHQAPLLLLLVHLRSMPCCRICWQSEQNQNQFTLRI